MVSTAVCWQGLAKCVPEMARGHLNRGVESCWARNFSKMASIRRGARLIEVRRLGLDSQILAVRKAGEQGLSSNAKSTLATHSSAQRIEKWHSGSGGNRDVLSFPISHPLLAEGNFA